MSQNLQSVNAAALGASFPEVTLPDGSRVQTGTVGALLVNVRKYNGAFRAGDKNTMAACEAAMRPSLPLLHKVGLFDLFAPEEWEQGSNEGRKLVGRMYREWLSSE